MLTQTVKASAVTHLTDARYFAAWEVDFLGFNLGMDGVSAHELLAFQEWIIGPKNVGELDAGLPARIEAGLFAPERLKELPLDALQVDGIFEPVNIEQYLKPLGLPIFLELTVEGYATISDLQELIQAHGSLVDKIILNFNKGGIRWQDLQQASPFSLEELVKLTETHSIFIEIEGALPTEIKNSLPKLSGFSVRGGSEEKVGYKDFDELDDFFEDIEAEG